MQTAGGTPRGKELVMFHIETLYQNILYGHSDCVLISPDLEGMGPITSSQALSKSFWLLDLMKSHCLRKPVPHINARYL